jgi:flagellar assembly factor FliW
MTPAEASAAPDAAPTIRVASRLFGPLRLTPDRVYTFPKGLLGFTGESRYALLPANRDGVFWLQSAEDGNLAFLVVDPFRFFDGYAADVPDDEMPFDTSVSQDLLVLNIVTLPRESGARPTANLQAPVVLHLGDRIGVQFVIRGTEHPSRKPFDLLAG